MLELRVTEATHQVSLSFLEVVQHIMVEKLLRMIYQYLNFFRVSERLLE